MLYVWILTTTFYCADQPPQVAAKYDCGGPGWMVAEAAGVPRSQETARIDQGGIFASANGCEDAAEKSRKVAAELDAHLRKTDSSGNFPRSPKITCERHKVNP
jgi:hypothetical protein